MCLFDILVKYKLHYSTLYIIYILYIEYIFYIYTYYKYEISRERERFVIRKTYYSLRYGLDFQSFWGGYFSISSHLAFFFKNSSSKKSTPSQSILCFGGSRSHIASPSLIVLPFFGRSACWVLPTEVLHTLNTHGETAKRFSFTGLQAIRDQLATSQV